MVKLEHLELAPGIIVYKNIYSGDIDLVNMIETLSSNGLLSWKDAQVKSGDENGINKNERDTKTIGIPFIDFSNNSLKNVANNAIELSAMLRSIFYPVEQNYFNNYGINFSNHDSYGILKYGVGQKFVNHIDDHPDFHRRISMIFYLNDDYSGGEINFPRFNISYKPNKNDMLIFPSTYVYNHSVSPVISGTRYAVVSWIK